MVKEELNQEEKLFESAVKTERFVKKYKIPLVSVVVAVVLVLVGNTLYQSSVSSAITASNEAYLTLLTSPDDAQAQKILKENNQALYDAYMLNTALKAKDEASLVSLSTSSSDVVADLSKYELAAMKKDKEALNAYALKQDAILKDLAILNEAVLLLQDNKIDEAHARLKLIDQQSSLQKVVTLLQHYGVK